MYNIKLAVWLFLKDICASTESSIETETSSNQTTSTQLVSSGDSRSQTPMQSISSGNTNTSRKSHRSSTAEVSSSEWHLQFHIPDVSTFSACVQDAISTGIVTSKARREIIQVLRTYMIAYTIKPTSEQYTTVCRSLITKFPNLKDDGEGKSSYVRFCILPTIYVSTFTVRDHGSWVCGLHSKTLERDTQKMKRLPKQLHHLIRPKSHHQREPEFILMMMVKLMMRFIWKHCNNYKCLNHTRRVVAIRNSSILWNWLNIEDIRGLEKSVRWFLMWLKHFHVYLQANG